MFEKELDYTIDEYVITAAEKRSNLVYMVRTNNSSRRFEQIMSNAITISSVHGVYSSFFQNKF